MSGLNPTLAAIKRNLPSVARSLGFQAHVTSGYRSRAAQTKLYNKYIQGLNPYPVAVPGTSDHEKGLALDVVSTDTKKLVDLLTSAGLRWAGEVDPVHFTMLGGKVPQIASQSQKSQYEEALDLHSYITSSPIEKIATFVSDPIGTIDRNLKIAFDVATWLIGK